MMTLLNCLTPLTSPGPGAPQVPVVGLHDLCVAAEEAGGQVSDDVRPGLRLQPAQPPAAGPRVLGQNLHTRALQTSAIWIFFSRFSQYFRFHI